MLVMVIKGTAISTLGYQVLVAVLWMAKGCHCKEPGFIGTDQVYRVYIISGLYVGYVRQWVRNPF